MLIGTIKQDQTVITFVAEDFRFTFMRPDEKNSSFTLIPDSCGYIWGKTYDHKIIAIFVRKKITFYQTQILNTWNYIIFKEPPAGFDGSGAFAEENGESPLFKAIQFTNGAIRSVNTCNALHEDLDAEQEIAQTMKNAGKDPGNYFVYCVKDDTKEFQVALNDEKKGGKDGAEDDIEATTWTFRSTVNQAMSAEKGEMLKNDTSILTLEFDKPQTLQSFYDYFGYVSTIMSFLTFRKDIAYEKIELMEEEILRGNNGGEHCFLSSFADCYVKTETDISHRQTWSTVSVGILDEAAFRNIVLCVVKKSHSDLPVSILPKNDEDVVWMSPDRIRNICTALEVELDAAGISSSQPDEVKEIVKCTKKVIKHFRKKSGTLANKTYENMFSSLGHWNNPLASRATEAWRRYNLLVDPMFIYWRVKVTERDIADFVKARNNITHRGFRELDEQLADTGFALIGLIYCMALKRIGLSDEVIMELMKRRLID